MDERRLTHARAGTDPKWTDAIPRDGRGAGKLLLELVRRGLEREHAPAAATLVLQLDADARARAVVRESAA